MSHANAALTPRARLRLARMIVEDDWKPAETAKMLMVSAVTARKWAARFREEGPGGMVDRSSRPRHCPHLTPEPVRRQILKLRWRQRLGPVQIGGRLGRPGLHCPRSLDPCRDQPALPDDRVTGEPIRRYEHPHPGALIHVDVTKFGNIPDGGGHRFVSRQQSRLNATAMAQRTGQRGKHYRPLIGTAYLHTVIDDHSRVAYVEVCGDEKAETAVGVLHRAVAWFADRGVTVERVLFDNGGFVTAPSPGAMPAPRSASSTNEPAHTDPRPTASANASTAPWPTAGPTPGSTHQRPNAEQHCPRGSTSDNHHRIHSAIGGTPISRLNNLAGHHS